MKWTITMQVELPSGTNITEANRIAHRMHEAAEAEMERQGIAVDDREIAFQIHDFSKKAEWPWTT